MATPGEDRITGGIVIIGSIFVIALLAGVSKNVGKIMVILMVGFLLLWLMTNGSKDIGGWLKKL
jgi:hypothetical protein